MRGVAAKAPLRPPGVGGGEGGAAATCSRTSCSSSNRSRSPFPNCCYSLATDPTALHLLGVLTQGPLAAQIL